MTGGGSPDGAAGGGWSIVPSPNSTPDTEANYLLGVACASAADCWAVGYHERNDGYVTLIEHWDGTAWVMFPSPDLNPARYNLLTAVTCVSSSDCWAVGFAQSATVTTETVIGHWDGTSWALVESPNPAGSLSSGLQAVTCTSATDCWAVGSYYTEGNPIEPPASKTLTVRWNGTSWKIVPSPNASPASPDVRLNNALQSVTCVSASDCWVAGYSYDSGGHITERKPTQTLIEHWDGTGWSIVASANTSPEQYNVLYGITCVSASDCWAVGIYYNDEEIGRTLVERWNGTSWDIVTSPNNSVGENGLGAITCVSPSDCWATGYSISSNFSQPQIQHWDGGMWTVVSSPTPSDNLGSSLTSSGLTCLSPSDCWAVGYNYVSSTVRSSVAHTLILHYTPDPSAPPTPTPPPLPDSCDGIDLVVDPAGDAVNRAPLGLRPTDQADITAISFSTDPAKTMLITEMTLKELSSTPSPGTTYTTYYVVWRSVDGNRYATRVSAPDPSGVLSYTWGRFGNTQLSTSNRTTGTFNPGKTGTITVNVPLSGIGNPTIPIDPTTDPTAAPAVTFPYAMTFGGVGVLGDGTVYPKPMDLAPDYGAGKRWAVCPSGITTPTVVSRKAHGTAGAFDINLPLTGNPSIECRSGGANGDHRIVFTFATAVTVNGSPDKAKVTSGTGAVSNVTVNGAEVTVDLTGVTNAQKITLTLFNVSDGTNTGDVSVPINVLLGDTTADGSVNSADISQTKSQSGQAVTASNFREDLTVDGSVNSADISLVKSKSGTALPPSP